jgi:membrane fusion protein, adhesin transport system
MHDIVKPEALADSPLSARMQPSRAANLLLFSIFGFFLAFVLWATFAELDQVTRGNGRVIPSSQLQVVQNLEGGIVREIVARQGDKVKKGDVLLRLDATQFGAEFARGQEGYNALVAKITRLQAEAGNGYPAFPSGLAQAAPGIVNAEQTLFSARQAELSASLAVAGSNLAQAQQQLLQVQAQAAAASQSQRLTAQEVEMITPLVEKGIEPRIELMRAQGRASEAAAQAEAARAGIGSASSAVSKARSESAAVRERYRARALEEMASAKTQLAAMGRELPALQDKVTRTDVIAPISGTVNRVLVATLGGVVRPGEPLVEIVPRDESLVIEAQVKPADIAFLRPGQPALVKITAFNFSRYGGLDGIVDYISPDAVKEERTGETFYLIRVRTKTSVLQTSKGPQPISAGMVAEVDVMNGKRSVLNYLLSPLQNVSDRALKE